MTRSTALRTKNKLPRFKSPLRLVNFMLAFALVGTILMLFASASPAVGFYGSVEQDQVNRINYTRNANGRGQLQHVECLNAIAEIQTERMARAGSIYHNPNLANEVTYACGKSWSLLGENVGVGYDSPSLFNAFMASPAHKANILDGRFTKVGLGAYYQSDGRLYVTQIFAKCINCGGTWSTNATLPADPVKPATVTGNVDLANCRKISGWTFDRDASSTSNDVHIYIDGAGYNAGATNILRPDVNQAFGISGNHGFSFAVPDQFRDGKQHTANIYGINVTGGPNVLIGSKTLDACASPIGNIDAVNCDVVYGWTLDMNDPSQSLDTHLYIDGPPGGGAVAGLNLGPTTTARPDVNSAYANYDATGNHGFSWTVSKQWKDGRTHSAWLYAINIGQGGNVFLGTRNFGPCY